MFVEAIADDNVVGIVAVGTEDLQGLPLRYSQERVSVHLRRPSIHSFIHSSIHLSIQSSIIYSFIRVRIHPPS